MDSLAFTVVGCGKQNREQTLSRKKPIMTRNTSWKHELYRKNMRHSVFLSLMVFFGLMYNWDLFHLDIVNYTFYLSKDKIQFRYDHLFAHRTGLHNHTLIHCCFNMSRKQDKSPSKFGGICWLDITWFRLEIPHWKKFPVKLMSILCQRTLLTDVFMVLI